jgi:IS30 family transposase
MRECIKLKRAPHVCNGCEKKYSCRLDKYYYRAELANNEYKQLLSSSREGINMTKNELHSLDKMISPRIMSGQPVSHVCLDIKNSLPVTERTIYNYVERGILSVKNIDLARKVKYKPRKNNDGEKKQKDRTYRIGRTYRDFEKYMQEHPDADVIEMDTVHGKSSEVGSKLLTMLFRRTNIMLIFLIPDLTAESVIEVFSILKDTLKSEKFKKTFPVFLTDNGMEFTQWLDYLSDANGEVLSEIFFCDPNAAYQKGRIEKNHEYIRYIIPKGKSFKSLTTVKVILMMNHINSTKRPSLNGLSPYEFGIRLLPDELTEALGLRLVPPDKILLKPELLK